MNTTILTCKTITPMFCYGADGQTPELRSTSLKGLLRFWWRAIHPNLSLQELKDKETKIFGGTSENDYSHEKRNSDDSKAMKSSFNIQLRSMDFQPINVNPLPHKKNSYTKLAIPTNTEFTIILRGKENLNYILSLLKLVSILSGIGGRSRRGFGCFQINKINDEIFDFKVSQDNILKLIQEINSDFEFNDFDRNYPYLQKIEIGKSYNDSNFLLLKIGKSSHENNSDYTGKALNGRYASPVYVSIFKKDNEYYPIISTLKRTIADIQGAEGKKNNFIKDILGVNNV